MQERIRLHQKEDNLKACNADLTACQASSQTLPGDGFANLDELGVLGHGSALSYTDNGDGTFTDNNTKLMWEKKTNVSGSVYNVNNAYTWSSSGTDADGTLFTAFLNTLNNKCSNETTTCTSDTDCTGIGNGKYGFAGHRDWRIPNIKELQSIVDYTKDNPASSVPSLTLSGAFYWSATTFANDSSRAWGVNVGETPLGGGVVLNDDKGSLTDFARAVRP